MVAHAASTLVLDVTMVGPHIPRDSLRPISPGTPVFPGYSVVRELGCGGMGIVYEAYHRQSGAHVAIKTMRSSHNRELEQRFFGEVVASQRIHHPSVVETLDYGHCARGNPFVVMEFLGGESLASLTARRELTVAEFCQVASQLVDVVAAAHRAGVLHRDIKPANIILIEDPEQPGGIRIKLIDFGIAKFVRNDAFVSANTAVGAVLGTPAYMSPEQCMGEEIDERSDVYAIGCVLFELLAQRTPFVGPVADVLTAQRNRTAPPVATFNPAVPLRLACLVDQMLRKSPADRPFSMNEVAFELARLEAERRGPRPSADAIEIVSLHSAENARGPLRSRLSRALFAIALGIGAGAAAATLTQI